MHVGPQKMTMFTRCTHCDAAFRVTLEQLQRSSGQVRCGVCQRVFDAFVALSASDPRADDNTETKKPPLPFGTTTADPIAFPDLAAPSTVSKSLVLRPDTPLKAPQLTTPRPQTTPSTTPPGSRSIEPSALPSSLEIVEVPGISVGFGDAPEPQTAAIFPSSRPAPRAADLNQDAIRKPNEASKPPRPMRIAESRWPLWASILSALLILQLLFWFRGNIANAAPEARPVLQGICSVFGCDVPLPRFADRLTIEASDLQALDPTRPNRVVLSATIRNRAPDAQAFPMLELTLTDSRDQVAARKVLAPDEYLDGAVDVSQGLASNGEATVRLRLDTGDIEAGGYRIYLFHP